MMMMMMMMMIMMMMIIIISRLLRLPRLVIKVSASRVVVGWLLDVPAT